MNYEIVETERNSVICKIEGCKNTKRASLVRHFPKNSGKKTRRWATLFCRQHLHVKSSMNKKDVSRVKRSDNLNVKLESE